MVALPSHSVVLNKRLGWPDACALQTVSQALCRNSATQTHIWHCIYRTRSLHAHIQHSFCYQQSHQLGLDKALDKCTKQTRAKQQSLRSTPHHIFTCITTRCNITLTLDITPGKSPLGQSTAQLHTPHVLLLPQQQQKQALPTPYTACCLCLRICCCSAAHVGIPGHFPLVKAASTLAAAATFCSSSGLLGSSTAAIPSS